MSDSDQGWKWLSRAADVWGFVGPIALALLTWLVGRMERLPAWGTLLLTLASVTLGVLLFVVGLPASRGTVALITAPILVLVAVGGALWVQFVMIPARARDAAPAMQNVFAKTFQNELIVMDNHTYVDCSFTNVTFKWSGGPYMIVRGNITGTNSFETRSSDVANTIDFLKMLGFLEPTFSASWKRREPPVEDAK